MKLGLLQCDVIESEFLPIDGSFSDMIEKLLGKHREDFELVCYRVYEHELPTEADECDAYVGGGSRNSVFQEEAWIQQFQHFVCELYALQKKFIGICFSHQMIAQAMGGKVERSKRGWGVGARNMQTTGIEPWMNPLLSQCRLLFSHQDQITRLPEGAKLLGGNDHCPNCMFSMGNHFLSIQAHPEYSLEYMRALMESRREIIPEPVLEAGLASMKTPINQSEIAQWIHQFLTS
ncbi:MAG: GMP synthase [Verrucomicrobiota bacterium]|nr:GMP synthase [Verrucomicrobiota bacterium]